jgi:hypothetical protein
MAVAGRAISAHMRSGRSTHGTPVLARSTSRLAWSLCAVGAAALSGAAGRSTVASRLACSPFGRSRRPRVVGARHRRHGVIATANGFFDGRVAEPLPADDESDLYHLAWELECERGARVAAVATEVDVDDVEHVVALQHKIADELQGRRDTPARVAAAKAPTVPELPPDTRPRRPVASWSARHYVRRR